MKQMRLWEILNVQITLFLLMLVGTLCSKLGILNDAGKKGVTDLCINVVIPCNIVTSFQIELEAEELAAYSKVLMIGVFMQGFYLIINQVLYNHVPAQRKRILQYGTLVPNGGFLGNPVAEGIYGTEGLLCASLFLIPQRIVMWSAGTTYFVSEKTDRKKVLLNVATHPCLVAVYIGIFLMITQLRLPGPIDATVRYVGACNTALTMIVVGTVLANENILTIFDKTAFWFSFLRLIALPFAACCTGRLIGMSGTALGVAVIMSGMPAGTTSAIYAARYGSDAAFASKCVVLSTLLSMVTIPVWCMLIR